MLERVLFCQKMMELFDAGHLTPDEIIFSDEAHFWLNGYFNKQNFRFWEKEDPHISEAKSLYLIKVTVWVVISVKGIYIEFTDESILSVKFIQIFWKKKYSPTRKKVWALQRCRLTKRSNTENNTDS